MDVHTQIPITSRGSLWRPLGHPSVWSRQTSALGSGREDGGMSTGLLEELGAAVGPANVVTDPEVMASYGIDWTGRFRGSPSAVVRPGDAAEVAAVVAACKEAGVALVPQGGNTGLVGGGVPSPARSCSACAGLPVSMTSTRWADSSPSVPGLRSPTSRRPQRLRVGRTGSTWPAVTVRRSVAPSPPTRADCRCSAMAPRGHSSWASKLCSGQAKPSRTWAV